jgi:hypothetical protein
MHVSLSSSSLQALEDKMREAATVEFDQRVMRLLWRSWWWFWFNFQKIFESLKEIW